MRKFIITIFIGLLTTQLFCAFVDQDFSARTNGLAGAVVGLADDVSCISFNPAGLRQVLVKSLALSYFKPYIGLPNISLNSLNLIYAHPLQNIGVFGISFNYFDVLDTYKENTFYLTYSNKLNDFIEDLGTEVYTGITFKFLNHSYNWDEETKKIAESLADPVITKESSASAFTLDLGSIIRLGKIVYLGISLLNVVPANVGVYYEDVVPMVIKTGVSFRKDINSNLIKKLNLNYDISYRTQDWGEYKDKINLHSAAEVYIYDKFVIRTGINFDNFSLGFSYFKEFHKNTKLELLYSFSLPFRITDNFGSHNISLVYSFGKPITEKKKEVIEEKIKVKEELLKEIFKEETPKEQELQPSTTTQQEIEQEQLQPSTTQQQEIKQEQLQPSTTEQQITPVKQEKKKDKKEIKEEDLEEDIMKKLLELEEKK
jgi:hypothetical protein